MICLISLFVQRKMMLLLIQGFVFPILKTTTKWKWIVVDVESAFKNAWSYVSEIAHGMQSALNVMYAQDHFMIRILVFFVILECTADKITLCKYKTIHGRIHLRSGVLSMPMSPIIPELKYLCFSTKII